MASHSTQSLKDNSTVIPAESSTAGIQEQRSLDSRVRGNDSYWTAEESSVSVLASSGRALVMRF